MCSPADTRSPVEVKNPLFPLGMLNIASYLRKYTDENFEFKYTNFNYEKEFSNFRPDLVLMTSVSARYNVTKWIAKRFKELDNSVPIIVGGHHITALPHTMTENMDIGVIREGEETMRELLPYVTSPHKGIRGIAYRATNGELIITQPRPLIKDLDILPLPARDIVSHRVIRGQNTGLITARGCPYHCIFCSNASFWGNKVRFYSAEYVVREIKEIVEKYTNKIMILDDTFSINKRRLRKISELIQAESLDLDLNVGGRADVIDEETCILLKKMGVNDMLLGLESGNQRILDYLKDGKVTVEDNYRALKLSKEKGIRVYGSIILGSPGETVEDVKDTLKLTTSENVWLSTANILTPLPDTPLWDEAMERGLVSEDDNMDWDKLNFARHNLSNPDKLVVMSDNLTRKQLFRLWRRFEIVKYIRLVKAGLSDPMRGIRYSWERLLRDINEVLGGSSAKS